MDSQGKLIGVNFAGTSTRPRDNVHYEGFAIPVDLVKKYVHQIIQTAAGEVGGRVTMGMVLAGDDVQRGLELEKGSLFGGLVITAVYQGSPADKVGLKETVAVRKPDGGALLEARDVVVAIDGKRVTTSDAFFTIVEAKMPGDTVLLTVSRVAKIGDLNRFAEIIPVKLATVSELHAQSQEFRKDYEMHDDGAIVPRQKAASET